MEGPGIRQFGQSLYPLTWSQPCTTQIQILYWPLKVKLMESGGIYWNILLWGKAILGTFS